MYRCVYNDKYQCINNAKQPHIIQHNNQPNTTATSFIYSISLTVAVCGQYNYCYK